MRVESIIVNAHGALVKSPRPFHSGATLTIQNEKLATKACAWVIWVSGGGEPGSFGVGIEFATPDPTFWDLSNGGLRARPNDI